MRLWIHIQWLDGGEFWIGFFKINFGSTIRGRLIFFAKYPFENNSYDAGYNY